MLTSLKKQSPSSTWTKSTPCYLFVCQATDVAGLLPGMDTWYALLHVESGV